MLKKTIREKYDENWNWRSKKIEENNKSLDFNFYVEF